MKKLIATAILLLSSAPVFANTMSCFVDTPAFDTFSVGFCSAVGNIDDPSRTTALFRVDNPPSDILSVIWSDSACSSSQTRCFVPITAFRPVTVTATVLRTNGTFFQVSATADYELAF